MLGKPLVIFPCMVYKVTAIFTKKNERKRVEMLFFSCLNMSEYVPNKTLSKCTVKIQNKYCKSMNVTYRKFTLSTAMVTTTDNVTSIMVNNKYFPKSGTVSDVGGIISANNKKNTVNDNKILIHNEIFSPESLGR